MLGVVQLQRMRYREALETLWRAAEQTQWSVSDIRYNVGIVLGRLITREANARQADLMAEFLALERARRESRSEASPLVSVVMLADGDADEIAGMLQSIAAQTYRDIEVVAVAGVFAHEAVARIEALAAGLPFPVRCLALPHRDAPAALNEGAAVAQGAYVTFLGAGDRYAPERIAALVNEVARPGCAWGFSLVASAPDAGADESKVDLLLQKQRSAVGSQPNSFAFVEYNLAASSSNLLVERRFFESLGGFRDYPHSHVWDFCLRASAQEEPAVVYRPLLTHRAQARDPASAQRANAEDDRVVQAFLARVLGDPAPCGNAIGPYAPRNRAVLLKVAFRTGVGRLVPVAFLRAMAAARMGEAQASAPASALPSSDAPRKTALVVLGMHRSGTSAMSRVLNLCGAFIPARVKPAKIGVNAKGFWEPEAVLELNVRALQQLGGDWNRVQFTLPEGGEIVDEFLGDAASLLAQEYEGRETIVIKDPRMCLLAPLWHRALTSAGYRPVYVVPIRNPLEVAQSLHARGDMTVRDGLALWSAYMERVAQFTANRADAFHVHFDDLLDDWRGVIGRIAGRFGVTLDAADRAGEVDRFLEHALRTHAATDADLAARCSQWSLPHIEAQYRASLERCDADASCGAIVYAGEAQREATAGFVLCIENNAIREQALLLCESIRRFAGRHRHAEIMAYAPRPGLGLDRDTRRRLADMDVTYVEEPLNTICLDYAPANRVLAGGHAEEHSRSDFLIVLDSDTVWLDEPDLPLTADAAARPVDFKGSATRGPGDRFEPYWERLAELGGMSLDRLPIVHSTIGNERIRVSYNAGLTVVRRDKGILRRCADLFRASLDAGMRPYAGSGLNVLASTGHVGEAGSEYWGSSQAALTLAIWSLTDRVLHYPDHYNVPLHLIAADSEVDPRWRVRPPVHLHYHYMFDAAHHEVAMDLLALLHVPDDRMAWLRERTPLDAGGARVDRPARAADADAAVNSPADRGSRERTGPSTIPAAS
jgi:glycosyltransferase involved in cell wall biosynthesis